MLADPTTLVTALGINSATLVGGATSHAFVATGRGESGSTYRYNVDSDTYYDLKVAHQYGTRRRFTFRVDETDTVANPLDTSKNIMKTSSLYIVADMPLALAPTNLTLMANVAGICLLTTTDNASLFSRIVNGET